MSSARSVRGRPRKTDGYADYATGTDAVRCTSADAEGKRRTLFTGAKSRPQHDRIPGHIGGSVRGLLGIHVTRRDDVERRHDAGSRLGVVWLA